MDIKVYISQIKRFISAVFAKKNIDFLSRIPFFNKEVNKG